MRNVAETPIFIRYASEIWSEVERQEFITFIAANPEAGAGIRGIANEDRRLGNIAHIKLCGIAVVSASTPTECHR